MILFGIGSIRMTRDTGTFECLDCQRSTEYRLRAKRNFITVYFIPVIPLHWESGDEEVQCTVCKSKYPAGILDGTWPIEHPDSIQESFNFMIRRFALVPMLVSNGIVQQSDLERLSGLCWQSYGGPVDPEQLDAEIQHVQTQGVADSMEALAVVKDTLDQSQKREMVKAAWRMGVMDGPLEPHEWKILADLGESLGMSAKSIDDAIVEAELYYPSGH